MRAKKQTLVLMVIVAGFITVSRAGADRDLWCPGP